MKLLNDLHHLAFITADMDRLIAFYDRVFAAPVTLDLEEEGLRHVLIEVGPHTLLHPFEVPGPDGGEHEVVWAKLGVPAAQTLRRAQSITVEMD